MIKKLIGIVFEGWVKGRPAPFHINHDYTSFSNIAGIPALHGLIFTKLNR